MVLLLVTEGEGRYVRVERKQTIGSVFKHFYRKHVVNLTHLVPELQKLALRFSEKKSTPKQHCLDVIALLEQIPFFELQKIEERFSTLEENGMIRALHIEKELSMTTMHLKKGERIELHDHPNMTGVIFGLVGAIEVEAFDVVESPSMGREYYCLRKGSSGKVTAGGSTFLTPESGNLHEVVALEDTVLLDVFCPPYQGDQERKWFRRDKRPVDDAAALYNAVECEAQYVSVGAFINETDGA